MTSTEYIFRVIARQCRYLIFSHTINHGSYPGVGECDLIGFADISITTMVMINT